MILGMRTPAWMVAYALTLVLLAGAYTALVFFGWQSAFLFALAALVAVVSALALTIWR